MPGVNNPKPVNIQTMTRSYHLATFSFDDPDRWDNAIAHLPGAHALQTQEWARVKAMVGWKAHPLLWEDAEGQIQAAALCLQRSVSLGGFALRANVMYVPRGPMANWADPTLREAILDDLQCFAKKQGAIFLKIDPDLPVGLGIPGAEEDQPQEAGLALQESLQKRGWVFSGEQIQFRNTVEVD